MGARGRRRKQEQPPTPSRHTRDVDHVGFAVRYARAARADAKREQHGLYLRLAAERFLAELEAAERGAPWTFDRDRANDACAFIEKLPHVEGTWETPTIRLHPAHAFFVVQLFGFRLADGRRRFSEALLAVARKNAKSTLAAAILLYCFCCEDENGPQVITAATTGSQARIIFRVAAEMVRKTPDLRAHFGLDAFANAITCWPVAGTFKPINAKASTQDGLNPSHTALDEIHAHKTHDLLNVLRSAAGARRSPLWLYTTTEGYETPGPWPEIREYAKNVLKRLFRVDHFLAVIFAVDDEDEDFDATKWIKANPLIDVNRELRTAIEKDATGARRMPGQLAEFRIKRLNRQSATARGWIRYDRWRACGRPVDLKALEPHTCYAAVDLASTTDFCSLRVVWCVDGVYHTWGRRWVPEAAVESRTERGTVPYAAWVGSRYLETMPGETNDQDVVAGAIREIASRFRLKAVAYDPWNSSQFVQKLSAEGIKLVPFIQGPKSYHPAMKEFERAYLAGRLTHGNDPVLSWCASNLVVRADVNLNMAPDRKKSADKIDDMAALLMAIGLKLQIEEAAPEFKLFVL